MKTVRNDHHAAHEAPELELLGGSALAIGSLLALAMTLALVACGPLKPAPLPTPPTPSLKPVLVVTCVPGARALMTGSSPSAPTGFRFEAVADAEGLIKFPAVLGDIQNLNLDLQAENHAVKLKVVALKEGGTNLNVEGCAPVIDPSFQVNIGPWPALVKAWTRAQIADIQGDFMLWIPELALRCDGSGYDPRANIRCGPRGLGAGYVWGISVIRYKAASDRELIYQAALRAGHTHFALHLGSCSPGGGYHDIYPDTVADCATAGERMNMVLRELRAHNLIPLGMGVSHDDPPLAGLDRSLLPLVFDDWDNSDQKDCRLNALQRWFPDALIFLEQPDWVATPQPDACSPVPFPSGGGSWIRAAQQRVPNFIGVGYEINYPSGFDVNRQQLVDRNGFWRDVQQVLLETDTYWKFWEGTNVDEARRYNDRLMAVAPWLRGCFSGCSTHPPITEQTTSGHFLGELSFAETQTVNAPDFRSWPQTTTITRVEIRTTGVHVVFDKQDGPNRWPDNTTPGWDGPLQYSLGLALRVHGTWYVNAPEELWHGRDEGGGQIQRQNIQDGTGRGQVAANWFYDSRWGPLQNYQPKPGEIIGVFVVAGDARNNFNPLKERSNIVLLPLPADGVSATFER